MFVDLENNVIFVVYSIDYYSELKMHIAIYASSPTKQIYI